MDVGDGSDGEGLVGAAGQRRRGRARPEGRGARGSGVKRVFWVQ